MSNHTSNAPEGFKMTELGLLPEEWVVARLDEAVTDMTAGDWGETNPEAHLHQCYVLRGTDFHQASRGSFINTPIRYVRTSSIQKRQLSEGHILVELSGGSKDQPTGRIALVNERMLNKSHLPLVFSNFVKRLTIGTNLWPEFFWRYWQHLYQDGVTRIYEKRTTGIRNFKLDDFLVSERIPLPPLPEQKAIAGVLATIQQAIEAQDKVIAATRDLKKSLMKHLFAYGPVPVADAERVPLKETEVGPVPEHWDVVRLGERCAVRGGKRLPKGHAFSGKHTRYPYIRVVDFVNGSVDMSNLRFLTDDDFRVISRYTISCEDVYVSIAGTIGLVGTIPDELNGANLTENAAKLVITQKDGLKRDYLKYCLLYEKQQRQISQLATKTSQPKLALSRIQQIGVPLPSIAEQEQIADMLSRVDKKIEAETMRKISLQTLFKTMLHNLMTGKVRVKDLGI